MKLLFALCMLFIAYSARSQELGIVAHGISYHAADAKHYNQDNLGLGVRLNFSTLALQAGSYNNSYSRTSNYLVLDLDLLRYNLSDRSKIELGPMFGVATGYPGYNILPGAGIQAALRYDDFYVRTRLMPGLTIPAVASVEVGYIFYKF